MSIIAKNKNIESVYIGRIFVSAIYKGSVKIYEAIKSCFGKGFWINNKPWLNKDAWKNN